MLLFSKYIRKFILKNSWLFIIGIIFLIAVDAISMLIPEFLADAVEIFGKEVLLTEDKIQISKLALYTVLVAAGMMVGRIIWRYTILRGSQKIEAGMRHEMFVKAEKLSVSYYHHHPVGNIMSWFTTDLETLEEFFGWGTVMLIDGIFLTAMVVVNMIRVDWQLAVVTFIPFIFIIIWGLLVEGFMGKLWANRQKAFDELYDFSQESFTGIRVIKAFVKENQQLMAFSKVARKNKNTNLNFARISVIFDIIIEILIGGIFAAVLGLGGYLVYYFTSDPSTPKYLLDPNSPIKLTLADMVKYIGYVDYLIWPTIAMGQVIAMLSRAKASLKRINNFLDSEEDVKSPKDAIKLENVKGKIEFKNLTYKYKSSKNPTLNNLSILINPGESIGIVGKIGCGKTTVTNLIMRLFNFEENKVFVDDVDLMKVDIDSLRSQIAYVPQDNFLFSDKVINNITFSDPNLAKEKVIDAAKFAQVHDDIEGFIDGYDTITGERGVSLSGGQKQRISIARAFIKDAPILIFDDSVSAVDVKTEEGILKNIKEKRAGKTTIVIASRISTVSHLDKILVLKEGSLEGFASHEELLKTCPTYQNMVRLQELEREVEGGK